jgi:hypothetical protein
MQVSCGNCQLSFDAPDGASGLVCPICRGPLAAKAENGAAPAKAVHDWSGGDLDDLIAILSGPAVSARVEVLGPTGDAAVGEVHLLAGGVSDALLAGKSTDDALDKLRAGKPKRFRVEQRLPNPADGDLTFPGPETGTLEGRALAHLMRYCEDYVITCAIEVWRGNENARVEYKRGEIVGVTVGGIDAPERLAEVINKWSSGNYRLVVPPLVLPAVAPKRPQAPAATPAPVPAPAPSAQAARQGSATKTIFGMPAADILKARAAAETARAAAAPPTARTTTGPNVIVSPQASVASPPPAAAAPPPAAATPARTPPGVAPSQVPAPVAPPQRGSATKTIFGVPSPAAPGGYIPVQQPTAPAAEASPAAPATPAADAPSGPTDDRKTGARKVAVPAPEVVSAPVAAAPPPAAVETPAKRPSAAAPVKAAPMPAPAPLEKEPPKKREAPILTYIWVGFAFGLALLGIYQLVGLLSH